MPYSEKERKEFNALLDALKIKKDELETYVESVRKLHRGFVRPEMQSALEASQKIYDSLKSQYDKKIIDSAGIYKMYIECIKAMNEFEASYNQYTEGFKFIVRDLKIVLDSLIEGLPIKISHEPIIAAQKKFTEAFSRLNQQGLKKDAYSKALMQLCNTICPEYNNLIRGGMTEKKMENFLGELAKAHIKFMNEVEDLDINEELIQDLLAGAQEMRQALFYFNVE